MNKSIWRWVALSMLLSSLLAGYIIYVMVQNKVDDAIIAQADQIQLSIHERFKVFDSLLKEDERELNKRINKILPELTAHLRKREGRLDSWSATELSTLAKQYNVTEIYIVDKATMVVATSFVPDLGFELGTISADLRDFLEGMLASKTDAIVVGRINVSTKTGIINKYAYFSPKGSPYVFEVSIEIKPYLKKRHSKEYVDFMFNELFTDIVGSQLLLESVDLFIVNDLVVLPFAGDVMTIPRAQLPVIPKVGNVSRVTNTGLEYYSRLALDGTLLDNKAYFLAVRTKFNTRSAKLMAFDLILSNFLIVGTTLLGVFLLINFIIVKKVVKRVSVVNKSLQRVSLGDYGEPCVVGGDDDISNIAEQINLMSTVLSEREQELKEVHDTLETRVKQRTESLEKEIAKREKAEKELNVLATTDALTKLPNRRLVDQYVERAIIASQRSGDRCAVMFLDLDNFKFVNDSLGHSAGDVLLKTIAFRLSSAIRSSDIAGRFGGDEFIILLQNLKGEREVVAQHIQTIAEQLLEAVRAEIPLGDHIHHCTLSIGITLSDDYSSVEMMYKQADTAMYRAKELGKNNFSFYEQSMQQAADERLLIERDLRQAINDEAFTLNYQPQLDFDEKLVGVEALIRWQKEDGSFMPPDHFIPIAEEIGLIIPIGDWVLVESCRQMVRWKGLGLKIPHISINISAKQFHQHDFVQHVLNIVKAHEIKPPSICLELTETATLDHQEHTIEKIHQLRALGFLVSIDDFGTGYSSLNYLKNLPIDQLKIDKSYIDGIGEHGNDSAIVNMIISMTHHLGLNLIAEGVETEQQLNYLKENGCNEYQGYYFSKPLNEDAFNAYVNGLQN